MSETTDIPVPDLESPLFAPFWKAASEKRLTIQCCGSCDTQRWPPRFRCRECGSFETSWVDRTPRATLFSWTVVGRQTARGYAEVPYAVGIVELEGEPNIRVIGKLEGVPLERLAVGIPLKAKFTPAGSDGQMTLIYWQLDE